MKRFSLSLSSLVCLILAFPLLVHAQGSFYCVVVTPSTGPPYCAVNTATAKCDPGYIPKAADCVHPLYLTCPTSAQTCIKNPTPTGPWYNQTPSQFAQSVFTPPPNEIFGERYTFAQVNWILNSIANIFSIPITSVEDFTKFLSRLLSQSTPPTFNDYAKLGLPGIALGGISEIYGHPLASGRDEIGQSLAQLNLAPPVHAQGYGQGYVALSAIKPIWVASRNLSYLLMVILLIAAGFTIMFRVKINPQTVVTLQLMIPKIILTLILVTFSYAIAGLVLDLVYVMIYLFLSALATAGVFQLTHLGTAIIFFTNNNFNYIITYFFIPIFLFFVGAAILTGIGAGIGALTGISAISAAGAIPGAIAALITIITFLAVLWILFKLWWMLLKTYITLMLLIIIGPFQIMLGLLPGQSGFGSWFRNIVANAAVFVVVPIMLVFNMLLWHTPFSLINMGGWPFIGTLFQTSLAPLGPTNASISANLPNLPFMSGNGIIFSIAVGYVILALTPKAAEMVRDALKAPAFKYGNAIGQPFGPARTLGRGAWGIVNDQANIYQAEVLDQSESNLLTTAIAFGQGAGLLQRRSRK